MIVVSLSISAKDAIWRTLTSVENMVLETHRILLNMEQHSKHPDLKNSEEYKTIQNIQKTCFNKMAEVGHKYDFFTTIFPIPTQFENDSFAQLFRDKRSFKVNHFFKIADVRNFVFNHFKAVELMAELIEISEQLQSYTDLMSCMEDDILENHLYYNFYSFHKCCLYGGSLYHQIKNSK